MEEKIYLISTSSITPNPYQPRLSFDQDKLEELSQSIKVNGILQPIIVRKSNFFGFELLAGERRLRAAELAGLSEVPVIIREYSDHDMMVLSILENLQREDMSPVDEAKSLKKLSEKAGMTHEEIAQLLGKSRSYISNLLRILHLPETILQMLDDKKLSFAHARTLLAVEDSDQQIELAHKIILEQLSVRQIENLIYSKKNKKNAKSKNIFIQDIEEKLAKSLGHKKIKLSSKNNRTGKLEISFSNLEELENLIEKLTK